MQINADELVRRFEENPIAALAAFGMLLTGLSKIIDAVGSAKGSRAYARDVDRRIKAARNR